MCNVCCKEFRGWCKSFTKTEVLLSLLEAFLLLVFIGFLTFLILHFIVCSKPDIRYELIPPSTTASPPNIGKPPVTGTSKQEIGSQSEVGSARSTLAPDVQCTWTPSHKTEATARHYEAGAAAPGASWPNNNDTKPSSGAVAAGMEDSDGEEVAEGREGFALALVKVHPTRESTFGCALTAVSRYWALTAASCLEAAEEVDSLDAFVMLEGWGRGATGAAHGVADVRVHPQYARAGRSRDVAALRSEDAFNVDAQDVMQLPSELDHVLITMGERFTIFGYGRFRTPEKTTSGAGVRAVSVYWLPAAACAGADAWAPRHLGAGARTWPATGDIAPICAGPLYARGVVCNYCAGTPLVRARRLLGVMADSARCGAACEPALYVPLAAVRPWLDDLVTTIIV